MDDIAADFERVLLFLITTLVRTAQGSATVDMITAMPIAKAFIVMALQGVAGLVLTMLAPWFWPMTQH